MPQNSAAHNVLFVVVSEWQEFSSAEAKPQRRFWDRAGAPLMTAVVDMKQPYHQQDNMVAFKLALLQCLQSSFGCELTDKRGGGIVRSSHAANGGLVPFVNRQGQTRPC